MAIPAIRYTNTFETELSYLTTSTYTINLRDATIGADLDLDFCTDDRGFVIDYPVEDTFFEDVIKGSSCTVGFLIEDSAQEAFINTLAVDQEGNYFIEILKNDILFWRGVVVQDESEKENRAFPYIFEITAIDGISELKTNRTPITLSGPKIGILPLNEFHTALQTIIFALNQTRTAILYENDRPFLVTGAKWYEVSMLTDIDPLANMAYVAQNIEWEYDKHGEKEYETHYDILGKLLSKLEIRLIQDLGLFNFLQVNQLRETHIRLWTYAKNYQTTDVNPQTAPLGVISTNVPTQLNTTLDNLLPIQQGVNFNHETEDVFSYIGAVRDVKVGYDFEIGNLGRIIEREMNLPGLFNTGLTVTSGSGYFLRLSGSTELSFNSISGSSGWFYATAVMDVTIKVGSQYSYGNSQWSATPKVAYSISQAISVAILPVPNVQVTSFPFSRLLDVSTVSGNLEIQTKFTLVFSTYSPVTTIVSSSTSADIDYQTLAGDPINIGYTATNNHLTTSSIEIDLGDTVIGDKPNNVLYNAWRVFSGATFTNSVEWQIEQTGTAYKISELLVREVLLPREEPSQKWEVNLLGDYTPFKTLEWDNKTFIFNGGTFIGATESWNMVALEMNVQAIFSIGIGSDPKNGTNPITSGKREIFENQVQSSKGFASFESISLGESTQFVTGTLSTLTFEAAIAGTIKAGDVLSLTNDDGKTEFITVSTDQEGGFINFDEKIFLYEYPLGVQLNTSNAEIKNRIENAISGYATLSGSAFATLEMLSEAVFLIRTAGTYTLQLIADVVNEKAFVTVKNNSGGNITVDTSGSDTIDGSATNVVSDLGFIRLAVNKADDNFEIV